MGILIHSGESVAGTKAALRKTFVTCFVFISSSLVPPPPSRGLLITCPDFAIQLYPCCFAHCSPWPHHSLLPSLRVCFSGGSMVIAQEGRSFNRSTGSCSAVMRPITPPHVGCVVLTSEALMRAGSFFSHLCLIPHPALKQLLKDSVKSMLQTRGRGQVELLRVQIKLFITLCKSNELLTSTNTQTHLLLLMPNHTLKDSLEQAVTQQMRSFASSCEES